MPKATSKTKKPAGRPKVEIDWNQVGKMLEAGATGEPDFTETTVELTNESIATQKES